MDCTLTRDRQRFWFQIWKDCGRPRNGHVYTSYKLVKKTYRNACRSAVNSNISVAYKSLNSLYARRDLRKFWNEVRAKKNTTNHSHNDIELHALVEHFRTKFTRDNNERNDFLESREVVAEHYNKLADTKMNYVFSEHRLQQCIDKLRVGRAAGIDGVLAEHIKYSSGSGVLARLSSMLTLCLRFGVVPKGFQQDLLIPILKKVNSDPSDPTKYRPITISSTLAKILEIYILEESGEHQFSDLQFGFIEGRGTNMAAALAHDVSQYCVKRGSPVYLCSLDAQGAFDEIPHEVLFRKCIDVTPDHCWRLLVLWYSDLSVRIKWNNNISDSIAVMKGTRQGGLSSPFLFNVFYQGLIDKVSSTVGGINIDGNRYSIFCYADDVLLASLTASGLQNLINVANNYVISHGLSFNPAKTECLTLGKSTLTPEPSWSIDGSVLQTAERITYLGVVLANSSSAHVVNRISSCRRAFYSLQGAGLCSRSRPDTSAYLWTTALRPILTYGLGAVSINKKDIASLEKAQAGMIKGAIGLSKFSTNSPLLDAIKIHKITDSIDHQQISLLRSVLRNTSKAGLFYKYLMKQHTSGRLHGHTDLVSRVKTVCDTKGISLVKYMFIDKYASQCKSSLVPPFSINDGFIDSIRQCLFYHNTDMLNLLLKSF